jgi:hypothetical protein
MDVNNLTNVYNQNPTLQGQYTLQQYLDLFGSSTPTTPTTPTTPNSGQGIINQNINQYQGGGSEGISMIGGIGDFGNLDPNTKKTVVRDVYNIETGMFEPKSIDTYLDKTGARKTLNNKNPTHAGMHGVKGIAGMIMEGLGMGPKKDEKGYSDGMIKGMFTGYTSKGNLTNMQFLKKNKDRSNYLKQVEKVIKAENLKKAEAKAKLERLAAEERALAQGQAPGGGTWQGGSPAYSYNGQGGGQFTDSQGNQDYNDPYDSGGGEKDGGYIDGTNRRVGYNEGGSTNGSGEKAFSGKVKELMDDGYEFGEAVKEAMKQGYANGGRVNYFKGGIVSLRGR